LAASLSMLKSFEFQIEQYKNLAIICSKFDVFLLNKSIVRDNLNFVKKIGPTSMTSDPNKFRQTVGET
jgi:hypothetical protein